MGKFYNNFQKSGGFSTFGKKLSDTGGRFMKVGANITTVAKYFSPELAEIGDAIRVAGELSQGIGGAIGTGLKIAEDFRADNTLGLVAGGTKLIGEGKALQKVWEAGKKLRFTG